ncbi:MAG: hypothetical protein KR126chlam1_00243 [Chlamydiae bacterium]|nr:hypothetical protein [Chlamydiota bacterium]
MNKGLFIRIFLCIGFFGFCIYTYIDMQNEITELRIRIPQLTKEVRRIEEGNTRLLFEIEAFESPENLMRLAGLSEYAHLKFPTGPQVLTLNVERASKSLSEKRGDRMRTKPSITFASGGNP